MSSFPSPTCGVWRRLGDTLRAMRLAAASIFMVGAAFAQVPTPFQPPASPNPKVVRLLAYAEYFDPEVLEAFERETGYAVAYDAYASPLEIAERWREGPYDVVVLPGPTLAHRIAAGSLAKLDRTKLLAARAVQGAVAAKLAAYDPGGAYSLAFGWSPFGLVYDADKAPARLGGAPNSWAALLDPRFSRKISDCGVSLPDARDALFVAAWRLMNVDPAHATFIDVKSAGVLLLRAKSALRSFAQSDIVGSLARGEDCLAAGTPGQANAALARRAGSSAASPIKFAYAKEGGPVSIDGFAIPRDARSPDLAYALIDFLMRPENASANARVAAVVSAEDASQIDALKHLWPEGAFDDRLAAAIETEWTHLRVAK